MTSKLKYIFQIKVSVTASVPLFRKIDLRKCNSFYIITKKYTADPEIGLSTKSILSHLDSQVSSANVEVNQILGIWKIRVPLDSK